MANSRITQNPFQTLIDGNKIALAQTEKMCIYILRSKCGKTPEMFSINTAQKAKYSCPNSSEYGAVDAVYTAVFRRIRLRMTRSTPGISYLNPACFSEFNFILPND